MLRFGTGCCQCRLIQPQGGVSRAQGWNSPTVRGVEKSLIRTSLVIAAFLQVL